MITPMLRPDLFGGLASHAGDALYKLCYLQGFGKVVRALRAYDDRRSAGHRRTQFRLLVLEARGERTVGVRSQPSPPGARGDGSGGRHLS
jgi:hypothetical protein